MMPKLVKRSDNPRPKKRKQSAGSAPVGQQAALSKAGVSSKRKVKTALERLNRGTDQVQIGSSIEIDDNIEAMTMEDAAKLINSVMYLVPGWIPFGMVTGLIAEPGVGKSAFALWLAFIIMAGKRWFTEARGPAPSKVVWCPTENDMAITKDRMEKWSVPFNKLLLPLHDDPLASVNLLSDEHLNRIEQLISKYKTPAVFIDSLRGAHDGDENCSRVGKVLKNLSEIAERTQAAIIVVHHTKKLMDGEEVSANSSRGSNAILALFRAQIGFDKPDPDSDWVRVRMLKQNLGLAPAPVGMRVTDKGLEFGEAPRKASRDTQGAKAAEWLLEYLSDGGWHLANETNDAAKQFGFSNNAIQRAREELDITTASGCIRRQPNSSLYQWKIPKSRGNT